MNTGSPIAARLGLNLYVVLFVAISLLALVFILWLISKKIDDYRNSSQFAEKNKNRSTNKHDINEIAKKAKVTKNEKAILSEIFKSHPLPNIIFAVRDQELLETYLKEEYKKLDSDLDEPGKTCFFSLRSKIYKYFGESSIIKNSRLIPQETSFTFTPSQGIHYQFELIENTPEELHIKLPAELSNEEKPEILSKIKLIFIYKNSAPYEMEARVIRYQKGKNDSSILVCAHTDRIFERQKRSAPRIDLNIPCIFASCKTATENNVTVYIPSEKKHEGILADSSAGGCRIITTLPIKAEQYIYINSSLDGAQLSEATGLILRTTKNKKDEYILHIKFVQIDGVTVNNINAAACGYNS